MQALKEWTSQTKSERQQTLERSLVTHVSEHRPDFLELVSAGDGGVYASMGPNYTSAIFGRDSIEVAEDTVQSHPELTREIIRTIAKLQGTKTDGFSEEEPGKVHHEYRSLYVNGERISEKSEQILRELQKIWGGSGTDEMTYYGSFDATPLYVRLVGDYARVHGKDILNETYPDRDGIEQNIAHSLRTAMSWLCEKLESSEIGLLEYKRMNPNGIINQAWKDSLTSYLFSDGTIADGDRGIASVELQGYAYDALIAACEMFAEDLRHCRYWQQLANRVQKATVEHMWMEGERCFAQGLARDEQGNFRQIDTLTSNMGLLMDSRLLINLPSHESKLYIEGLVDMLMGDEFLTDVGIRSRAKRHYAHPGYLDYHGTYTVWPKETYDIARGLRRHGYHLLANELEQRIIDSVKDSGEFYEFFYVDTDGRVFYEPAGALEFFKNRRGAEPMCVPEPGQAWVISAVEAIMYERTRRHETFVPSQHEVEALRTIGVMPDAASAT